MDGAHELVELRRVETTIGAKTAADVNSKRLHLSDRLSDILWIQSARQINRDPDGVANFPADGPIVSAARAAKLFCGKRWIPGIEKKCVHLR